MLLKLNTVDQYGVAVSRQRCFKYVCRTSMLGNRRKCVYDACKKVTKDLREFPNLGRVCFVGLFLSSFSLAYQRWMILTQEIRSHGIVNML